LGLNLEERPAMSDTEFLLSDVHWLMDMLQTIEVGVLVLDEDNRIRVWNGFMENHSGIASSEVQGRELFEQFPELPQAWLERKIATVRLLHIPTFSAWEQRPYLFRFSNRRPITGTEPQMYQNITFCPLTNIRGDIEYVCLLIYDVTDIASNSRQLERSNTQLRHLSQTDGLTGLYNRATWQAFLDTEFQRGKRYGSEASLVMLDIDHFKPINDTHGHPAGDQVIRKISALIKHNLRQPDLAGRYGGEEFAVILPETNLEGARCFAERLRESVEKTRIDCGSVELAVTISLGVATLASAHASADHWLEAADRALYKAKESGRNRVEGPGFGA